MDVGAADAEGEPPQEGGSQSRRELLLIHGARAFAEHGFAGARVSDIARRAGVNTQLISYYFGGKEGLYEAIHVWMTDMMEPTWDEFERATPREALRRLYAGPTAHTPVWRSLLAWEGSERALHPHLPAYVESARAAAWARQTDVIRRAQVNGDLRNDLDPAIVSLMLTVLANAPHLLPHVTRMISGREAGAEEFSQAYGDLLDAVIEGLRP